MFLNLPFRFSLCMWGHFIFYQKFIIFHFLWIIKPTLPILWVSEKTLREIKPSSFMVSNSTAQMHTCVYIHYWWIALPQQWWHNPRMSHITVFNHLKSLRSGVMQCWLLICLTGLLCFEHIAIWSQKQFFYMQLHQVFYFYLYMEFENPRMLETSLNNDHS